MSIFQSLYIFIDIRGVILTLGFPKGGGSMLTPHLIVSNDESILGFFMNSIQNIY